MWTLLVFFALGVPDNPTANVEYGVMQIHSLATEAACDDAAQRAADERPPGAKPLFYTCVRRTAGDPPPEGKPAGQEGQGI